MYNSWDDYYKDIVDNGISFYQILDWINVQREFLNAILKAKPRKILEVGIGSGMLSLFLSKMGLDVTSIDYSLDLIIQGSILNKEYSAKTKLCLTNAYNLSFSNDSFDLVFHQGLFEHFSDENLTRLLREQLRVAKCVMFSVPTIYYPRRDYGNERLLSKESWERIFSNFNITKSVYYYYKRPSIEYRRFKLYTNWGKPEHLYMKIDR